MNLQDLLNRKLTNITKEYDSNLLVFTFDDQIDLEIFSMPDDMKLHLSIIEYQLRKEVVRRTDVP